MIYSNHNRSLYNLILIEEDEYMKKKLLSILVVLTMVAAMLPVMTMTAFAADWLYEDLDCEAGIAQTKAMKERGTIPIRR